VALARAVMERYGGKLPEDPAELATLPGIGRKSANVIASVLFQAPVIAVDTHVFRVSRRLGLAKGNTPEKVEQELMAVIPASYLGRAHHWLILFGRYHCLARRPKCGECPFTELCDWYQSQLSGAGAPEVSGEGADGEGGEVEKAVSEGDGGGALPSAKPKKATKHGRHRAFEWGAGFGDGGPVDAQKLGGAVCGDYFSVWAAACGGVRGGAGGGGGAGHSAGDFGYRAVVGAFRGGVGAHQ
jgi:adenine-specific DNA glycosylase